jgi:hypothetical protein
MIRNLSISNSFHGLMAADFYPESESVLNEIRKNYQEYKNKERLANEARKRRSFITGIYAFSGLTGLMVILLWLRPML